MSDIFEGMNLNGTFDGDQLIEKLVHRILTHQAEIRTLTSLLSNVFAKVNGLTDDQTAKIVAKLMEDNLHDVIINDELTIDMVNKLNREQLGLVEGSTPESTE